MSIEDTVKRLGFDAAKPEIADIEKDIAFAIEGHHAAAAIVALVRVLGDLISESPHYIRAEMLRRTMIVLAERGTRGDRQ
jgi:hypothetical protein